jgi:hypothetical protein
MTDIAPANEPPEGQIILFQSEDGQTRLEVHLQNESIWLSLNQMAELFDRDKSVISKHIKNIFEESEVAKESVVANFATTAADGKTYQVDYYNLDVIISVGYRVKSLRGTQFRIWATQRLREYLIKGFTIDDARLKQAGGANYFDELLAKIRDIRSSERVFWRKVLDIYATSVDYDLRAEASALFFKTMQNKMHWAAHGHTAAEIVRQRADAGKPNMGLTAWAGGKPRKSDIVITKNYLNAEELDALNRIVTAYLEFAELQALNKRPMTMNDWISKLDDFLRLSGRELLNHAGKVSHDQASQLAAAQFEQYQKQKDALPHPVDQHFEQTLDELKKIELKARAKKTKPQKRQKKDHDME